MQTRSDAWLLRDYAEHGGEAAFTELVQRHTNLVYSAALRQVESPDIAGEIAQSVFVSLARGAKTLAPKLAADASLAGWLCRSARNLSLNHRRDEFRRRTRERHAMEQTLAGAETRPDWGTLRQVLDDAMSELNETDYDSIVLRFFQNQDFRSVGTAIGVSDDTAQKRVARALDKLRDLLAQRGIRTTATALSVVISANAVQAAPAGLAVTISTAALVGSTVSVSTIAATATKTIAMTTIQKTVVAATCTLLIAVGSYEALLVSRLRDQNQALRQQQDSVGEQVEQLQRERDETASRLSALADELQSSNSPSTELLKLRAEVGRLRQQAAMDQARAKSPAETVAKLMNESSAVELARVQIRQTLKNRYAPLTQQMNLSPETTDKLFNLITENELNKKTLYAQLLSGDLDVTTALQSRTQATTELERQAKELLGDSGFAQLDQFNHHTDAGELVKGLNRELGDLALNEEQGRRIRELFAAKPDIIIDELDLFRSGESLDALFQTLVDRGHHDLQEAASFLTPEQHAAAVTIQSNYFNTLRNQLTLGQRSISNARKKN